jgi:hypothetical protein
VAEAAVTTLVQVVRVAHLVGRAAEVQQEIVRVERVEQHHRPLKVSQVVVVGAEQILGLLEVAVVLVSLAATVAVLAAVMVEMVYLPQ